MTEVTLKICDDLRDLADAILDGKWEPPIGAAFTCHDACEELMSLQDKLATMESAAIEQSETVQRDWTSPYEGKLLRLRIEELEASLAVVTTIKTKENHDE